MLKRTLITATTLTLFGLGCATAAVAPNVSTATVTTTKQYTPDDAFEHADIVLRQPGDFVVYRFSGSYRDTPVMMRQQIVALTEKYTLMDTEIEDGSKSYRLRMRMREDGEVVSVAKLDGDVQRPFGLDAYEKLMNDLMLVADENKGVVDSAEDLVDVAGMPLHVTLTSYSVRVGTQDAVMKTMVAEDFAWGDVGGEVVTNDGKVLYRAEIIELGGEKTQPVAVQAEDEVYDDL